MEEIKLYLKEAEEDAVRFAWERIPEKEGIKEAVYEVYWADRYTPHMKYKWIAQTKETEYVLRRSAHIPHYLRVEAKSAEGRTLGESAVLKTPVKKVLRPQLERLNRGLVALKTKDGVFLAWRMLLDEVSGWTQSGMSGTDYVVYRNRERLAVVTECTCYVDAQGTDGSSTRWRPSGMEKKENAASL